MLGVEELSEDSQDTVDEGEHLQQGQQAPECFLSASSWQKVRTSHPKL